MEITDATYDYFMGLETEKQKDVATIQRLLNRVSFLEKLVELQEEERMSKKPMKTSKALQEALDSYLFQWGARRDWNVEKILKKEIKYHKRKEEFEAREAKRQQKQITNIHTKKEGEDYAPDK